MQKVDISIATKLRVALINNCGIFLKYFSALHNSMTKLCSAFFLIWKQTKNWLINVMHSFKVHSNDHFTDRQITPLEIWHSNISVKSPVKWEIFLLEPCPFMAQGHNMRHFGPFCTRIYIISTAFWWSLKVAKKTKIWCHVLDFMYILQRPWWAKQGKGGFYALYSSYERTWEGLIHSLSL